MYKITLSNGNIIDNLELNGNCYISEDLTITDQTFLEGLNPVVINNGENDTVYSDMILRRLWIDNGKTWIAITEKSDSEKQVSQQEQDRADIDYLLMLGGE